MSFVINLSFLPTTQCFLYLPSIVYGAANNPLHVFIATPCYPVCPSSLPSLSILYVPHLQS
jgi:hypothetical protein